MKRDVRELRPVTIPVFVALTALLQCSPSIDGGPGSSGGSAGASGGAGGTKAGAAGAAGSSSGSGGTGNFDAGTPDSGAPVGTGGSSGIPVDPSCNLPGAAFCDAFTEASPGGRAGDLDDARWAMARLGFGCAYQFSFPDTPLNLCGVWKTVAPGGADSQFCLNEDNEPRWTEGFDDNADFNYLSARIRQPFDFSGRTGTIQWQADARTSGSHGWWTETWITAEPVPGPNLHDPDQLVTSKQAVGIVLDLNCGKPSAGAGTAGSGFVGVSRILVSNDYDPKNTYDPFSGPNANSRCVTTEQNKLNTFQIRMSASRIEVWASDAGSSTLERIAEANVSLGFSRGFVHFSHVHYNAQKAEVTTFQSYQWARIAFDGPALAIPRAYSIPDPLTRVPTSCNGNKQGYRISRGVTDGVVYDLGKSPSTPETLVFAGVDPSRAVAARLNFNTTYVAPGDTISYRLNGKTWQRHSMAPGMTNWARQGFSVPVPVSDLIAGNNSVEFATDSNPGFGVPKNGMHISNIDLEIEVP
ncbi:MAG TPA: hypothetical protein VK524_34190 [Polyangiaceae bacterium]|nr:hypothetical protein [Polyangiaceae bacterium]